MYISKISINNFKGFKGEHEINFDKGVNFFVGDNNCGKTSIFEAVEFIRSKRTRDEVITKTATDEEVVSVEVEFKGDDLQSLIETEPLKKYKSYLIDSDGEKSLRVMRSSKENTITQDKKDKKLSIANVRVYNPASEQFENPTGVDNTISALFDAQFVWADIDSSDVSDFSKTKICGKIINVITKDFVNSDTWKRFSDSHEEAFGNGEKSITTTLKPVQEKLKTILSDQYGDTEVKFSFSLPEIESFFKSGDIELSENGIQTKSEEKGTGMQRALALALIQVYADISSTNSKGQSKPILFFIDEPETFLHPRAQNKLLDALEKISADSQIFVITHSPYLLKKYKKDTHSMTIFSKVDGFNTVTEGTEFDLFGTSSPTWGEINYYAFAVISVEFHNELYGFIQAQAILQDEKYYKTENFDDYLVGKNSTISKNLKYKHLKADGTVIEYDTTLPTKIRNIIHHPENSNNTMFTDSELRESIELLIPILK